MKVNSTNRWSSVLGAGLLSGIAASVVAVPYAHGELVVGEPATEQVTTVQAVPAIQVAPAVQTVPVIQAAPVAQAQLPAPATIQVHQVQTSEPQIQVGPAQTLLTDAESLPRSELLRRERGRQEKNNEEALRERLEELRLREELRRTEELKATLSNLGGAQAQPAPVVQQAVAAPVTERPGVVVASQDHVLVSQAAAVSMAEDEDSDHTILYIAPRAGLGEMRGTVEYDIRPRFTTGIGLGLVSSDNLSFEVNYAFSEYGVALASGNPYVQWANAYGYNPNVESVAMKQNVVDAGLKLHFLGPKAKLRPFIGGGAAYALSYINYDQRILDVLNRDAYLRTLATDYELTQYLGYLATGLDLKVNKSMSVGAVFKYYTVLSSRERGPLNNPALYGYPYYGGYSVSSGDYEKQYVGGSLARTSFYSILGGVTFVF